MKQPLPDRRAVSAIVFDLDGTLYLQPPVRRAMALRLLGAGIRTPALAWKDWRVIRAYRQAQERLRAQGEPLAGAQLQLACEQSGVRTEDASRAVARWMDDAPLDILARHIRPGIVDLLISAAGKGIRLGVLSDYPARRKLEAMSLDHYFSAVVCAQDPRIGLLKPSPKGLLAVLADLGVNPENAVYVGDRPSVDGETARRAGVRGIVIGVPEGRNGTGWIGVPDAPGLARLLEL